MQSPEGFDRPTSEEMGLNGEKLPHDVVIPEPDKPESNEIEIDPSVAELGRFDYEIALKETALARPEFSESELSGLRKKQRELENQAESQSPEIDRLSKDLEAKKAELEQAENSFMHKLSGGRFGAKKREGLLSEIEKLSQALDPLVKEREKGREDAARSRKEMESREGGLVGVKNDLHIQETGRTTLRKEMTPQMRKYESVVAQFDPANPVVAGYIARVLEKSQGFDSTQYAVTVVGQMSKALAIGFAKKFASEEGKPVRTPMIRKNWELGFGLDDSAFDDYLKGQKEKGAFALNEGHPMREVEAESTALLVGKLIRSICLGTKRGNELFSNFAQVARVLYDRVKPADSGLRSDQKLFRFLQPFLEDLYRSQKNKGGELRSAHRILFQACASETA